MCMAIRKCKISCYLHIKWSTSGLDNFHIMFLGTYMEFVYITLDDMKNVLKHLCIYRIYIQQSLHTYIQTHWRLHIFSCGLARGELALVQYLTNWRPRGFRYATGLDLVIHCHRLHEREDQTLVAKLGKITIIFIKVWKCMFEDLFVFW